MDFGKFFGDVGKNVSNFFNGGSEEEKRRKAEEARQKAAQLAQQKAQQAQQIQQQKTTQPSVGSLTIPTVNQQKTQPTPQQTGNRPTVANPFSLETLQPQQPPKKVEPLKVDKKEAEAIPGFFVMSPEAQQKALVEQRVKAGIKEPKPAGYISPEDQERLKGLGNIPIVGTAANWGAGLTALFGKATGNKSLEDDGNNRRNLLSLGMSTEELEKYDKETQDKLRILQNVVTGAGALDIFGVASLAKAPIIQGAKQVAKEGLTETAKLALKETGKQTLKQYKNNVIGGVVVGGVADPAIQAYIKDGEVDWSSVPSSMLQGGLWAAAIPEFSGKQKLVQKLQAGDVLTPDDSKILNKALRDGEGVEAPESTSFAPLDEATQTKTTGLKTEAENTPRPAGTTRLYQMTENGVPSPNYFDNPEQLANYANGRSQNVDFRFVDVPENQAQRVAGKKGEAGVFEIKPDEGSVEGVQAMLNKVDEAQEPIEDVQAQAAQQAQGGSSRGINMEEAMATLRERNRVYNEADPETKAEIDARASQTNPDDVTLETPYSREAVYSDLQGVGLTPQDITTITQRYDMTAQDWRAVLNASGDLSGARNKAAVLDSQIRNVLKKEPVARDNSVPTKPAEAPAQEPDLTSPEWKVTPQGYVNTQTGEIVEIDPNYGRGTSPFDEAPEVEAPRTESIYENNIAEVRGKMEAMLSEVDDALQTAGSSWADLSRKIQAADRNQTPPQLSEVEARAYSLVRTELDDILQQAQATGRANETNSREFYLPQQREGSVKLPETMEDIYNTGLGYDQSRTNAIELEDLDYGFSPVVDYAIKGRAAENLRKQTIFENYRSESPDAPIEQLEAATELRHANDTNINKLTEDPKADPNKIDTVGTQAKIAETLGIQRTDNNAKLARGLNVRDGLDNAGVLNSGFNQYRRAQALAQNFETPEQLYSAIRQTPDQNGLGLVDITQERAAKIIERLRTNIDKAETPEMQEALMANAIRSLSKANIDEMLLKTNFTDPNLSKLVNGEYNRMAIGFNKAQSVGDKVGMGLRRVMNTSMRGFNLNSALTELTDVVNAMSIYGGAAWKNLNPAGTNAVLERWGQSGIVARMDNPDKAAEVFDALGRGDKTALKRISDAANTVEEKLALYRYGENYKAALFLKSAEDYWNQVDPNLQGTALTNRVLDEFDKNMLPLDHFTRVFKSDNQVVKLMTQYLDWNILNTRQQARNLVGSNDSGIYKDMNRGSRIARNLAVNLAPRVGVGLVRGVPLVTTIGVLDPFGFASQDFSGIEDKNAVDEIMDVAGVSPLLSLITGAYFNYRQDEETAKNYEGQEQPEDNRGDWLERSARNVEKMFTPYGGQIGSYDQILRNFGIDVGGSANGRGSQAVELMDKGYSENKNGRVQYLAPDNLPDQVRAFLMGKNQTENGREYSGTPDIFSVMAGDATLADLWNSNSTVETLSNTEGDYIRPVTDRDFTVGKDEAGNAMTKNFNDMIKNADSREEQEAILAQSREYNAVLDDFRKENPQGAEAYDRIMSDNDLVSPEYWKEITGTNSDGSINLDIFKMIGDRKKKLAETLGAPYDPMYDLPDDQARSLLQLKSTATGDDLALRNILYKSDWYGDYVDRRSAFYDALPEATDNESRQSTERVKQWNEYDKQLNSFSTLSTPELQQKFPYNAAYKAAQAEYEAKTGGTYFGSEESKTWFANYGQGKKAEDEALDAAKLAVINQMRVIEGFPPMNADEYAQATEIADTSKGGSGGGGGGGQYDFVPEFYNSFRPTDAPATAKVKVPTFNPNTDVGRRTNSKKSLGARSSGGNTYTL